MVIRPGIELANLTDTGLVRSANEDYYCYTEPDDNDVFRVKGRLAVVADGMGGHIGGQVASGLAVDTIRNSYLSDPSEDPRESLVAAFRDAHAAIHQYVREHPELKSMGTTCTAAVVRDFHLYYGHIGDSRLYLVHNGAISQVTRDHSMVNRLVEEGKLSPEEAAVHPDRNVLTAALGMEKQPEADFSEQPLDLWAGDSILICSDGLHGLVADEEMVRVVNTCSPREACVELVDLAKQRGGHDNITVQILKLEGEAPPRPDLGKTRIN
jgi:serine/threonine protein phosphatase PrpC